MKTIGEVSEMTGVSVRALRYYDGLGLLRPDAVTEAGYRLYGEETLRRLELIMLFRELGIPLAEIKAALDSPDFDLEAALQSQIRLLELQKERTERLIGLAKDIMEKGVDKLDFSAFDRTEQKRLEQEAKERWGGTAAYGEYEKKSKDRTPTENSLLGGEMAEIFRELGARRELPPESAETQTLVKRLQDFITEHYYTCTDVILRSLGEMYVGDGRFTESIDGAGGEGTAALAKKAIDIFCDSRK